MDDCCYQFIVVGYSRLAEVCAEKILNHCPGQPVLYILPKSEERKKLSKASSSGLNPNIHTRFWGRTETMEYLAGISRKTFVISVCNRFLFPTHVVENENLTIVNQHHSLLPRHRGRNAEAWALFAGDREAGITWHLVATGVDNGPAVLQKSLEVKGTETSLQLFRAMNELVVDSMDEIIHMLLADTLKEHMVTLELTDEPIHQVNDRPNGGVLDLSWDMEMMDRFLRVMNYGVLKVLGDPEVCVDGTRYKWKKYQFLDCDALDGLQIQDNSIIICKEKRKLILQNITEIQEDHGL